jgi:hypothetical protein
MMSDVRSETGLTPSPKLAPTGATPKLAALRDSQLMTPPFSPAKVGDIALPRNGDDSLAFYLPKDTVVDGPLFPEEVSTASTVAQPPSVPMVWVDVVQGRGIKRKLVPDNDEPETKRLKATAPRGEWFVVKYTRHHDLKRYLEEQKARIGRMKLFNPRARSVVATLQVTETPVRRSHKRGASGNIKRGRPVATIRSPRVKAVVDFNTSTRANGTVDPVIDARSIKVARPRPTPKPVDPNAPPKVSKGQRSDAEFEEALIATASPIYYPPNDNLDRLGPNAMKVEWKSSKKLYTSQEYTRFPSLKDVKFHSKEVDLAGTINMVHFAQYEESKRLIFQFWYERKSKGMTFTKTHAQQAAHVDVNKASALWTAFDKVSWFSDEAFRLVSKNKKSWYA